MNYYKNNTMNEFMNYDKNSMLELIRNYDSQILHAIEIGKSISLKHSYGIINKILVLGMGGSAIGGDLLRAFTSIYKALENIIIITNRDYNIPNWVDENTLVIASSYSGNTEETLSGLQQAKDITNNVVCITSGGKLHEIAQENNWDILAMPSGFQPRAALAYSVIILLYFLKSANILKNENFDKLINDLELLPEFIKSKCDEYQANDNYARHLANKLAGKIPVIFSSEAILGSINIRWRGQIHENAKTNAFGSFLPEMNHNEINSFSNPEHLQSDFFFIFLKDTSDHAKIAKRIDAMIEIWELSDNYEIISSREVAPILRMFDLLYLADWVSYYLSINYSEDPIAIPLITKLKNILSD